MIHLKDLKNICHLHAAKAAHLHTPRNNAFTHYFNTPWMQKIHFQKCVKKCIMQI